MAAAQAATRASSAKRATPKPATKATKTATKRTRTPPAAAANPPKERAAATPEPSRPTAARRRAKANGNGATRNIPGGVNPADLATAASNVTLLVQRAASILEEELSTGIDAVQRLETRFVDVESQRARDDDDLIFRFRRDAHDIVDILMDLIDVAGGGVGGLARRAIRISGGEETTEVRSPRVRNGAARVTVLEVADPIARGQRGTVQMSIENEDDEAINSFALVSSGLVNENGDHIGPELIEFEPPKFDLPGQGTQRVVVTVSVPETATPGAYSGVVQTTKLEGVRAVLVVTVV